MRRLTLGAALVISASITAPAFAQVVYYGPAPYPYAPPYYYRTYSVPPGSYAPTNNDEWWNQVNHGFSGRDPSRVGSVSPNITPPGN